jgi:hypothetical protein
VGLGALKGERHAPKEAEKVSLRVVDADVKVLQPKNSELVPLIRVLSKNPASFVRQVTPR